MRTFQVLQNMVLVLAVSNDCLFISRHVDFVISARRRHWGQGFPLQARKMYICAMLAQRRPWRRWCGPAEAGPFLMR